MSEQEWWAFPRMPGWKYEYANKVGADTEIRPFGPHYRIVVEPRTADAPCEIRSVKRKDARALRRAFSEAFFGYIDYIYSTEKQVADLGSRLLRRFFSHGSEELCRMASCLAIDPGNPKRVIGAALLAPVQGYDLRTTNEAPIEPQLQPVFVVPDWQRKGVATALVCELIARLWKAGHRVLRSGCSDYNTVSKEWHLAFGVTEELRYFARRPIFHWLRNEIWRKAYLWETQGIRFEPDEKLRLETWVMALGAELDELEEAYYGISSGGRGCNSYREEARRLIGRRQKR